MLNFLKKKFAPATIISFLLNVDGSLMPKIKKSAFEIAVNYTLPFARVFRALGTPSRFLLTLSLLARGRKMNAERHLFKVAKKI